MLRVLRDCLVLHGHKTSQGKCITGLVRLTGKQKPVKHAKNIPYPCLTSMDIDGNIAHAAGYVG